LRVELPIDVPDEKGTLANSWPSNDDGFIVLETGVV
jgi:hypothetical protein